MNKTEITNKCREILYKYLVWYKIHWEDVDFILSVFENHREWESKKWCWISHITTENAIRWTKCFVLHRKDGSSTDISFVKCITHPRNIETIKRACRNAVQPTINDFRSKNVIYWVSMCHITNEILEKDNTHIDHYDMEFDEVYQIWSKNYTEEYLFSKINKTEDNSYETYFVDDNIKKDFIEFHNQNTHLRPISKKANLSTLRIWKKNQNTLSRFWTLF